MNCLKKKYTYTTIKRRKINLIKKEKRKEFKKETKILYSALYIYIKYIMKMCTKEPQKK